MLQGLGNYQCQERAGRETRRQSEKNANAQIIKHAQRFPVRGWVPVISGHRGVALAAVDAPCRAVKVPCDL